ncbi:helix-turn-helix domain-containing protein [Cohnella sp.]|uniref:helix-turn-helix domain-containing protein n=1 Tax=Cohnella sp. TaxID=1883426 RepID=UPI003562D27F
MKNNWLNKNYKAANEYMNAVCQESTLTSKHKGFTIVPHKIHRCYGLSEYEKLILIDLVAYMSDKNLCYPTIEMLARNVGCSSKSIERHIAGLSEKKMILVSQDRKNNTYYLPSYFHTHPYLLMSEKAHEFVGNVRKNVNERELTLWVQGIVKSKEYKAFTVRLHKLYEGRFIPKFAEQEILDSFTQHLYSELAKRFPPDVNGQ